MIKKLINYFIPDDKNAFIEQHRKYRLVVSIILITAVFNLNYALLSKMSGMKEGIYLMLTTFVVNCCLPFILKFARPSYTTLSNLYVFLNALSLYGCIYFSGGFKSPVLPWLASTPIVALLMADRKTGIVWAAINTLVALTFSFFDKQGHTFPNNYDPNMVNYFTTNCITGLVLIIFVVALVFEDGKNNALKKLKMQSELLAEERKKAALNLISTEIHDDVGQSLSLVKANLHLIDMLKKEDPSHNLKDTVQLLGESIQKLRQLSHDIYEQGEPVNIFEFIRKELDKLEKLAGLSTVFNPPSVPVNIGSQTSHVLSRIFKEALNNIMKHAKASRVVVDVSCMPHQFLLFIKDDGIGLDMSELKNQGQGIKSMYSRVNLVGGNFIVKSEKGKGTCLEITIPVSSYAAS